MESKNGIKLSEVKKYLDLTKTIKEMERKIGDFKEKFLRVIPADGYRYVGSYKVCHKTQRKKSTAWKQVCIKEIGQEAVDEICDNALLGAASHSITIEKFKIEGRKNAKDKN